MSQTLVHLVDDDAAVRAGVGLLLRSDGHAVRAYDSAAALLQALEQAPPEAAADVASCVLTDVRMPGMDGIMLLVRLRALYPALRVVVMTGHGDVATAVRAMKEGASDFIEKPFDDDQLLAAIAAAIGPRRPEAAPDALFQDAARRIATLSRREGEVLDLLVAGRANKVIAHELGLSERTVEVHRARMMERLGVRSLPEAVRLSVLAQLAGTQGR